MKHTPILDSKAGRQGPTAGANAGRPWFRRLRRSSPWLLAAAAVASVSMLVPVGWSSAADDPNEGLLCTNSGSASFAVTAQTGYITTPDLNSIFMWSYSNGNGQFQYPGPNLCVTEGDSVTVTLRNNLPVPTSIAFVGIERVKADGELSQPDFATNSLNKPAPKGGSVTYTFTASKPGTYLYESGTDPELQVKMGLVGALIVKPKGHPDMVYAPQPGYPSTQFAPGKEYVHLLSEIDPDMHQAVEQSKSFEMTRYKARYFMINGRSFPDTIAPNLSQHLPSQPYGSIVHVKPRSAANPLPAVIRYLNAGPVNYPFHPHSNHERIVGVDGRQLVNPNAGAAGTPSDTSVDHFGIVVPPGQTMEGLFTWVDAQDWNGDTNPIGVPVPTQQDRTEGAYWSGSPYLGSKGPLAVGKTNYNQCGEFYHVAHSHALFQATNYGISGTGMLTMVRVDPPDCKPSGGA